MVKVCGVTCPEDALAACRAGASMIGVIFAEGSKRAASREQAAAVVEAVREFGERDGKGGGDVGGGTLVEKTAALAAACRRPQVVGVFQNQPAALVNEIVKECGLDFAQLHGKEGMEACGDIDVPVLRVVDIAADDSRPGAEIGEEIVKGLTDHPAAILLDASVRGVGGGAGVSFNWDVAKYVQGCGIPVIVAGGLSGDNVEAVVKEVGPFGVDASSGVEKPGVYGVKDRGRVEEFVRRALEAGERGREGI